ncbi:MAG: NAD(P)/FAD-dependent oxidoreductase [Pseudomonadota bacterium]
MAQTPPDYDAIVVGAGAAGLAATQRLCDAGRRVICLEAADRIGGRSYTDTSIFGVPFDLGGHWLHYADVNAFIPIGQALGFDLYEAEDQLHFDCGLPESEMFERLAAVDIALARHVDAGDDIPMTHAFAPQDAVDNTALLLKALSAGRDLDEISMAEWVTAGLEENNWFCRQGFGAIVCRNGADLPVRLNTPVSAITRTPQGVNVTTAHGTLRAARVIVTVSVGVLAAEAIRFDPPLAGARLTALDYITMGTYNHAAMLFQEGTLPVGMDAWVSYPLSEISGKMARGGGFLCNISGTGLTSFEHVGAFARELEAAGADVAVDFALSRLVDVFGTDIRKGFIKGHATRWGANAHTRGAYSGTSPGGVGMRGTLREVHEGAVHFAGEAMNEGETVTISGAHREGLRAANEVLSALGHRTQSA